MKTVSAIYIIKLKELINKKTYKIKLDINYCSVNGSERFFLQ